MNPMDLIAFACLASAVWMLWVAYDLWKRNGQPLDREKDGWW